MHHEETYILSLIEGILKMLNMQCNDGMKFHLRSDTHILD